MSADRTATDPSSPAIDPRIEELRLSVDALDRRIVALLAERTAVVRELTGFKRDEETVRSPGRVEQVVAKVRGLADEHGMPPGIAEATYRTLIDELTRMQMVLLDERRAAAAAAAGAAAGEGP
ncbi:MULTISPECIES: chorismate mutase [unclassified Streptomyces]|uniref:chorismate mutase n=1 Tax=unclassified Streptomyces TaxID=2593676 RepID=UPI0005F8C307|nr:MULTISPECIES: chorismate mutase [unclassified Streptomyces]KJY38174.1 chorismate mutase [Streptomyces sp. NRRL S-495]KOV33155.1 chorismate mutase [Streptomyces sp. XY431]